MHLLVKEMIKLLRIKNKLDFKKEIKPFLIKFSNSMLRAY